MSRVILLAGPNGAGKSTCARSLLHGLFQVDEFVNADVLAQGLSAFDPESVAFEAGRIMLRRLRELAAAHADFAFETTLASRSFFPWLSKLAMQGYEVRILYLYLSSPELAIARVLDRVRRGGHSIPDGTVRRRYDRGLLNFFSLYRALAVEWQFMDNDLAAAPSLVASGERDRITRIDRPGTWQQLVQRYGNA